MGSSPGWSGVELPARCGNTMYTSWTVYFVHTLRVGVVIFLLLLGFFFFNVSFHCTLFVLIRGVKEQFNVNYCWQY